MRDLGISTTDDDGLNEEQFYRILDTQGDVAYAQAIDPPVALLTFDGQTIQQVLSSSVTTAGDDGTATTTTTTTTATTTSATLSPSIVAAQLLSPLP